MDSPLKILVADDSATQAAFLKMALKRKGYEVTVARDGVEAVELAYREMPDLIISDIIMPRLNGYQVCRLLKDDHSLGNPPIILLTSLDEKVDMFWGLKSGAALYLTKVPDVDLLVADIEAFIKKVNLTPRIRGAGEYAEGSVQSHDIIGRVIQLLDRNLFESTVINEIGRLVDNLEDYKKIMISVLEILGKVVDFDLGMVALLGEEGREYYILFNGQLTEGVITEARNIMDNYLAGEGGAASLPEDIRLELYSPKGLTPEPGNRADLKIGSQHIIRLQTKGVSSGAIGIFNLKEIPFSSRIISTFTLISRQANIVIDYARLYERNKQLSITDGLTKVFNHRYFQECLRREFSRSTRHKSNLALCILDIDHFKKFNDTYGHQQGDIVLSELARILRRGIRSLDIISRYGGEEFTVLMPDANITDAMKAADRLRKSVESYRFPRKDEDHEFLTVTISMGVAAIPHPLICNQAQLINAADQALYQAKKNGRNRVEQAT